MGSYKHAISVTAQVYFCASPIRIDSYNKCQFGCTYCFSRNRSSNNALKGLKEINTFALQRRFDRVAEGNLNSALDEFLERRVPIQLGGLQDPFSPMESQKQATLRTLRVLHEHNYPTIISTKGDLCISDEYLKLLSEMNVYVRVSAAGIAENLRPGFDVNCGPFKDTLNRIRTLNDAKIPVSLRIQPVVPGFEKHSLRMAKRAIKAGASHISFEYLKLATEGLAQTTKRISNVLGFDIYEKMKYAGMKPLGRDYALLSKAKQPFLSQAREICGELGAKFGAGDTEFIPYSDGGGCCSGAGHFLKDAHEFRSNLAGVVSANRKSGHIYFSDLKKEWSPQKAINTYLTTNSRGRDETGKYSDWLSLIAHRWNGGRSPYSPEIFDGVSWTGQYDDQGFKIYKLIETL